MFQKPIASGLVLFSRASGLSSNHSNAKDHATSASQHNSHGGVRCLYDENRGTHGDEKCEPVFLNELEAQKLRDIAMILVYSKQQSNLQIVKSWKLEVGIDCEFQFASRFPEPSSHPPPKEKRVDSRQLGVPILKLMYFVNDLSWEKRKKQPFPFWAGTIFGGNSHHYHQSLDFQQAVQHVVLCEPILNISFTEQ